MKPFFIEIPNFWAWADKFWGIWDIFGQFISPHFGTVSPLSMFSINQPLFLQKTKHLYPNHKYLFGIGILILIWTAKNCVSVVHRIVPITIMGSNETPSVAVILCTPFILGMAKLIWLNIE